MAETIKIDLEVDDRSISGLNEKMDKLKDKMVGVTDPEQFAKLTKEAAKYEREIKRIDDSISEMAESNGELSQMGTTLGGIGGSLASLDFKSASEGASRLASISSKMTFGSAITSLKQLGSTFAKVGKALLTNPVFLIAGIIIAIGVAIYKLMDELGLLTVIMEAVGKVFDWLMVPINALIDGLKDLTDWFGWTNNAAQESADGQAKAAQKAADAWTEASDVSVMRLDHQIRMIKASGDISENDANLISKYERQKREAIIKSTQARVDSAKAAINAAKVKGESDEEALEELQDNLNKEVNALEVANNEKEAFAIEDGIATQERRRGNIKAEKEAKEELREINKEYRQDRLEAEREIQDLSLKIMEDGIQKELKTIQLTFDRRIEDVKSNEELTQSEKTMIIEKHNLIREIKRQEEFQKQRDKNQEHRLKEAAIRKEFEDLISSDRQLTESQKLQEEYDMRIVKLREFLEKEAITKQEFDNQKSEAEQRLEGGLKKIKDDAAAEDRTRAEETAAFEESVRQQNEAAIISGVTSILATTAEAAGEGSAVAKAAGIAKATIDTYTAATGAYASLAGIPVVGPVLGGVAAAAAVAAGVINIKNIASTPIPGGGGGGGGGSAPTPQIPATGQGETTPTFNLFDSNGNPTNEGDDNINESGDGSPKETKVVVQLSDIQETWNTSDKIKKASVL